MKEDKEAQVQKNTGKRHISLRYIIAAVLLLFFVIFVFVFQLIQPKFDPASDRIIREAAAIQLDKDPNDLTDEDFAKITELSIGEKDQQITALYRSLPITYAFNKLSDIKLLEKFTNLQILHLGRIDIDQNKIPKWMIILAKYRIIDLEERFALDLSPLKKLNNLQELQIGGNSVNNIGPLAGLNLKSLQLISASVSDIKPVKSMKQLESFVTIFCWNIKYEDLEEITKTVPGIQITTSTLPGN